MNCDIFGAIYAGLVAAGGIFGYIKAGSLPSLIAGISAGCLAAFGVGGVLGVLMTVRFISTGKVMPPGVIAALRIFIQTISHAMEEIGICVFTYYDNESESLQPMLNEIVDDTSSLEDGALLPVGSGTDIGAKIFEIPIDTKYFATKIQLWVFNNFGALTQWKSSRNEGVKVGASVVQVNNSSINDKFLNDLKSVMSAAIAETWMVIVNGDSTRCSSNFNGLQNYCTQEAIELIELQPTEETKQALAEFSESFGYKRLLEILGTVEWPNRKMKPNPTSRREHLQRIQGIIRDLEEGNNLDHLKRSNPPENLRKDIPNSLDEADILKYFGHILNDETVFPKSEQKTQVKGKMTTEVNKASNKGQSSTSTRILPPAKTSKISKPNETPTVCSSQPQSTSTRNDGSSRDKNEELKPQSSSEFFIAEDGTETNVKLTDILESVLRENGRSVQLPFPLRFDNDRPNEKYDISSMLGHLNELKQQSMNLGREERVSLASKVSLSVLDSLTQNDSSSDDEVDFGEFSSVAKGNSNEASIEQIERKTDLNHMKAE